MGILLKNYNNSNTSINQLIDVLQKLPGGISSDATSLYIDDILLDLSGGGECLPSTISLSDSNWSPWITANPRRNLSAKDCALNRNKIIYEDV